jgi:hypothetical protein
MGRYSCWASIIAAAAAFGCERARFEGNWTPDNTHDNIVTQTTVEPVASDFTGDVEESFKIDVPKGPEWQVLQRGPLEGVEDTYILAMADLNRSFQITVTVFPVLKDAPTLNAMRQGWEQGVLAEGLRKKSSQMIKIDGRDAYMLVGALNAPDGTPFELVNILIVTERWNFTLGITKPGENIFADPEVKEIVDSFNIADRL